MSLQNFFKNRYNILYMMIVLMLCVLGFRMAVLTVVEGEEYRALADIKKIKDIPVKAPRGKIYDRNGVLLADNVTSFTAQMYTDEIDPKNFNEISYVLSNILDKNGERPIDEFPIELYTFEYIDESLEYKIPETQENLAFSTDIAEISSYVTAEEKAIQLIKDNTNEWLNYKTTIYNEEFNNKEKVLNIIIKDIEVPIKLENDQFIFLDLPKTEENIDTENNKDTAIKPDEAIEIKKDPIKEWLKRNELNENLKAEQVISQLLKNNNKYLSSLFFNSKIRKLSYDFLTSKNLNSNIKLVEYSFVQDEYFKDIKKGLNVTHEEITLKTTAKEDFVLLTMKYSLDSLLQNVYKSETEKIIPGAILIERLKEVYPDLPVEFKDNGDTGSYEYTNEEVVSKYLSQNNMEQSIDPYNFIKQLSFKNIEILQNLITDDKIKYYSQIELLKYENPSISIAEWEYTPIRDKRLWIEKNIKTQEKETNFNYSAEKVFKLLRETLKISPEINDYEMRNMMVIRERYNKTSFLSYHPVDICYSLSEKSVAMISERSHELNGINVEIEPLRYYPQNETAAHAIGYLGKIAQDYEIKDYIVKKGYSPDDIIGKTGLEEKFEDYLRGEKGKKTVEVNNVGKTIRSISSQAPVPGNDLYLTIDSRIQKKAEEVLKKGLEQIQIGGVFDSEWGNFIYKDKYENAKSGALVALDVKTGEVLAMANYPSYDLNMFATGISQENWNSLLSDSKNPLAPRPLYNIAMLSAIQPGSTFKMITALAALEKGVDPNTSVYCAGTEKVGDRYFSCWIYNMFGGKHGYQNMYQAIMNSCNFYFYTTVLGENLATHQKHTVKVDAVDIIEMADKFGLNSKTGIEIDIPQENSGGVPSIEGKKLNTRVYLRMFLEANIEKYLAIGYKIDAGMKNEIVEEIASWVDRDEPLTRGEVYDRLKALSLDPEKSNDYNVPLVDIIKYTYLNQAIWNVGDNLNISIGQGNNAYTTIQMANYISTIANGGYRHNVSIIKEIKAYEGKKTEYEPLREAERVVLSDYSYLDVVKKGMRLVSLDDSAKPYSNFPVVVGSKTGTAQNQGTNPDTGKPYDDFAWYVAFAPYDDPQIAVVCLIFEGGSGRYPTPIVREVIGEYLKLYNNASTSQ